jgi:hypothetical protein
MSWTLNIGIIRGSDIMSRDSHSTKTHFDDCEKPLDSLSDCTLTLQKWAAMYRKSGYQINWASAKDSENVLHGIK